MGLFEDLFDFDGDGDVDLDDDFMFMTMMNQINNTSGDRNSGSGDGCYIATCVYGSYDCPQVWVLRRFRDFRLAQTRFGRLFIHVYYVVSPKVVALFGDTNVFQRFFRKKLDALVVKLRAEGISDKPYKDINWRSK